MKIKSEKVCFTVILRTCQSEKTLYPCIRSLFHQTCHDFEVLVSDQGSTDRTLSRLDFYCRISPVPFTVYRKEYSLAEVVRQAKGEYLLILDPQCWMKPQTLQNLKQKITETRAELIVSARRPVFRLPFFKGRREQEIPDKRTALICLFHQKVDNGLADRIVHRAYTEQLLSQGTAGVIMHARTVLFLYEPFTDRQKKEENVPSFLESVLRFDPTLRTHGLKMIRRLQTKLILSRIAGNKVDFLKHWNELKEKKKKISTS